MLTRTHEETVALQTALGNQHGGAYDFTSGNAVYAGNPEWPKYLAEKMVESYPRTSMEQATALANVADVAARDNHERGWTELLAKLESYLESYLA